MDTGLPLFDRFPDGPGFKEPTTSKDAAEALVKSGRHATLLEDVLAFYKAGNCATADECAAALGENALSVRPRCSQLATKGLIRSTGERRASLAGGRQSHVWEWA